MTTKNNRIKIGAVNNTSNFDNLVLAYEPVWAIGTGLNANESEIEEFQTSINNELDTVVSRAESKQPADGSVARSTVYGEGVA